MKRLFTRTLLAAAFALSAVTLSAEAPLQLLGCVFGSNAGNKSGIYRISTTAPEMELLNDKAQATGGGTYGKGKYYCQWYITMLGMDIWTNMTFDATTWEWEGGIGQLESQAFDLAYDNATDRIYGCFHDPDENYIGARLVFGWMDPATYSTDYAPVHPVCDLFECFSGLAFDGQGRLFALTKEGKLVIVNKQTGEYDLIGQTGLTTVYNSSAAIDPETGLMYYFLCTDEETALYTINTETAEATKIYVLPGGEEVQGLAIFESQADQKAPAAATELSTDFDGGNLTGNVNFTIPAKTYDGKPAEGAVGYKIGYREYADTEGSYQQLAEGTSEFGAEVSAPVTLPANGQYSFSIVLSSVNGEESPAAITDTYVGYDTPLSPLEVKLTAEGTNLTLSWTPSENTLHNGYMDKEALTYRIVRYPDEAVVAEAWTGTTFTDNPGTPATHTRYHYTVQTNNHGMLSYAQASNFVVLGSFSIPYRCDFESADDFAEFTVITKEAAPDNYFYWQYHTGLQAAHVGNGRVADDDILISPAIAFEGGRKYKVTVEVSNDNANAAARFRLCAGSAPTRQAMTEYTLGDVVEFTSKRPDKMTFDGVFTPAADGMYHLGIHSLTPAETWDDLFVYSIAADLADEDAIESVAGTAVEIAAAAGRVSITGAERLPVTVTALNGVVCYHTAKAADTITVNLPSGFYIVSAGSATRRILLR